ncbi:hypothetical protein V7793_05245 [Streptomyces sp. KLMMK]
MWSVKDVKILRGTTDAPCVRSHVTNDVNTAAGGELGRAVQADRILENEPYQVITDL